MKETAAKRRDKAGRDRESKAEKSKEPAPQDVEMPEEETASAAKLPGELDSVTLDGKPNQISNVVVKSLRHSGPGQLELDLFGPGSQRRMLA